MPKVNTAIIQNLTNTSDENGYGAVVEPIVMSTTFERNREGVFPEGRDIYTRASNPNRRTLEGKLALLEGGIEAVTFASGQAATMSVFHSLGANSHVILPDDIYYGTKVLIETLYASWGMSYTAVDMTSLAAIEAALKENTKLIWIESPSNPSLKVTDIGAVASFAKSKGILTACDNTWATPYFCKPFDFGVDLIMHSTTKYFGGHSDILGGAIITSENTPNELLTAIRNFQVLGGAVPSAQDCWLLSRSLSTFHVRMPVHGQNAIALAEYLNTHTAIEKVFYPGLANNQGYEVSKKQMQNGFGGMLSVIIKGDEANCLKVASKLKVFKHATSLGGVESLVDHRRSAEGEHSVSPPNLLRISVGIESIDDLIADFDQALV